MICKCCGKEVEEEKLVKVFMKNENGVYTVETVCEECLEKHFDKCEFCGEYHPREIMTETADGLVCEICLDSIYKKCEDCGEYYRANDMRYVAGYGYICEDCFNDNWYICNRCGEYIRNNETYFYDNEPYCEDCYDYVCDNEDYEDERILSYHGNRGDWTSYRTAEEENKNNLRYIGFELEIEHEDDTYRNQRKAIDKIQENINCYLEHDGSLNDGGFEIVSQPQTYNYIMQNFNKYKDTFDTLIKLGYISHNSRNCGLHFHVTAPKDKREDIVSRLWLILENYKDEFEKVSRRRGNFEWCHFLSNTSDARNDMLEGIYKMKKVYKNGQRYLVINNSNSNTLEIRLFRGTLRAETFFADLQLVNNLFNLAYDLSIDIQDITWAKLTEGEYIQAYCEEHKIYTDKVIKDNTIELITLENKAKRLSKNIYNEYARYIKSSKINTKLEKINMKYVSIFKNELYEYTNALNLLANLDYYINNDNINWYNIFDILDDLKRLSRNKNWNVDNIKIDSKTYKIKDYVRQLQ